MKTIHDLIGRYWDIAYKEGKTGISHGTEAQEVLSEINLALSPDDTALLRMALEALDTIYASTHPYREDGSSTLSTESVELSNAAITALRERLGEKV